MLGKKIVITYADNAFIKSQQRLKKELTDFDEFDQIFCYSPNDLDTEFKIRFKNILEKKRGAGYWIWKHHIIYRKLMEIEYDDVLIYIDSGCSINKNNKKRFHEYLAMINNNEYGIIGFLQNNYEHMWSIKQIYDIFDKKVVIGEKQFLAGVVIMKKCNHTIKIFKEYSDLMLNYSHFITDDYNNTVQHPHFRENRHDQSFYSMLLKKHGCIILNEEEFEKHISPIYTSRIRD